MKKYITLATLLAAGSLAANAASGWHYDYELQNVLEKVGYENGDAFSIEATLSQLGNENKGFITLAPNYYVVNQGHEYWGLNNESSNSLAGNNAWTLAVSGNNYTYTSTEDVLPILWTQNKDGNGSATRTVGKDLTVGISSDGTDSTIKLSYKGTDIVDTFVLKGTVLDATKIDFEDNIGSAIGNITIDETTYTLIPEPSAFGLLAGLGALALVGTRRRRK